MKPVRMFDVQGRPLGDVAAWVVDEDKFWIEADRYLSQKFTGSATVRISMIDGSYLEMVS